MDQEGDYQNSLPTNSLYIFRRGGICSSQQNVRPLPISAISRTNDHSGLEEYIFQLAQWGYSATVQAYNKPVLPGVIIAFVNRDGQVDPKDYDLDKAKDSLFDKPSFKDITRDPKLQEHVGYWAENGQKITTAEELLLCYYSSINVVQFPDGKDPTRMRQQIAKLYQKINTVCSDLRKQREIALMKWDASTLPRFIRKAFTHFACNYQIPFNFSDAWVDIQRLSFNYEGSIFDLAIKTQKARGISGWELWEAISVFSASCLFLNCVRENQPGMCFRMRWRVIQEI